ncbi:hypothetical protein G9F71_000735 [Clostridium sp. FP2]|uniref:hypothetical protein n=1 Tax=Clostridium sp. FP2 TaxID=2724481 RepID=UPI0013E94713|nr:hypothetical protein [Clostridium sp. FP2]MBZ9621417.1 hypothetical protein [Clostridium sp. FP2]
MIFNYCESKLLYTKYKYEREYNIMESITKKNQVEKKKKTTVNIKYKQEKECEELLNYLRAMMGE